jgi:hypothetical protein
MLEKKGLASPLPSHALKFNAKHEYFLNIYKEIQLKAAPYYFF